MNRIRCFAVPRSASALLISSVIWFTGCCSTRQSVDLTPVASVDLTRYSGQWYEIARYDHWFERGMTNTKATYTKLDDGSVRVVNSGLKDGKEKVAVGKGEPTDRQGLLRVSFFWPFYGDYRILWLDADYRHALVGGGSAKYLWVLSRTPAVDLPVKNTILKEARRRGYDTDMLIWVKQQ